MSPSTEIVSPSMPDLADLQGNILRAYGMDYIRVVALRIDDAATAKDFLRELDGRRPDLRITSAAKWDVKPPFAINAGFSHEGLQALGLPAESLDSFPAEFKAAASDRAAWLGDVGTSDPSHWGYGLEPQPGTAGAHMLLIVHAQTAEALETAFAGLGGLMQQHPFATESGHINGADLPDSRVHFGYVDGIAQPHIQGNDKDEPPDDQPVVPVGEFFLGYPGLNNAAYPTPAPEALGRNGTYLALRILKQDVDAFEEFLEDNAHLVPAPPGVDARELLAAKLCGRWRNGVPLTLSPDTDIPADAITPERRNQFDYVANGLVAGAVDDTHGIRCPIGSHIRRSNPRSGTVAGGGGHNHRLIRRGIPYGAAYDPKHPHDGIERGLIGLFFCGSLANQFEFIMREWLGQDAFGLHGDVDPLISGSGPTVGRFQIPTGEKPSPPIVLTTLSQFITTRGSLYCFIPSLTAIRYICGSEAYPKLRGLEV